MYLPDCLTGAIPDELIVLEDELVAVSASLSLVFKTTLDVASVSYTHLTLPTIYSV